MTLESYLMPLDERAASHRRANARTIRQALLTAPDADLDAHISELNTLVSRKRKDLNDAINALADALSEKEARSHG